jgi:hypothetical protein
MVKAGNDLGGISIDGMTKQNEDLNGRRILSGFQHADVFAGDASGGGNFLLGETGF